jgi:predicted DCC family thiol-disulfide oxidoreductase YuxK
LILKSYWPRKRLFEKQLAAKSAKTNRPKFHYLYYMVLQNKGVILFDGVCNLCNGFVQKVISADKNDYFRFASLQSNEAKNLLKDHPELVNLKTIIFLENDEIYTRSTAALKVSKHLSGIWPFLQTGYIFPVFLRDGIYNFIAKNRYKWFGKKNQCMVPSSGVKSKFL